MLTAPASNATLEQWLDYLFYPYPTEIDMGLTRVSRSRKPLAY